MQGEITLADNLVIVESPAKAKTIEKYLEKDIKLLLQWDTFVTYLEVKWVWTLKITMNQNILQFAVRAGRQRFKETCEEGKSFSCK